MSERRVDRGNDSDSLTDVTIRADGFQRVVLRVLGPRRVQRRAECQHKFRRLGVEAESLQVDDGGWRGIRLHDHAGDVMALGRVKLVGVGDRRRI